MKVPHTEPLNTTQSSNKPAGFEVVRRGHDSLPKQQSEIDPKFS